MGISRQEYWGGLPCPPPGDLPNRGIKPRSPELQLDSLPSETPGKPKNTGIGSLSLLQGIFPTQELNRGLLHCRWIVYQVSYQGNPPRVGRLSHLQGIFPTQISNPGLLHCGQILYHLRHQGSPKTASRKCYSQWEWRAGMPMHVKPLWVNEVRNRGRSSLYSGDQEECHSWTQCKCHLMLLKDDIPKLLVLDVESPSKVLQATRVCSCHSHSFPYPFLI